MNKIIIQNNIQKIQAYKLIPMVFKHMANYLNNRYGVKVKKFNFIKVL